jgi:hypothetical protein
MSCNSSLLRCGRMQIVGTKGKMKGNKKELRKCAHCGQPRQIGKAVQRF